MIHHDLRDYLTTSELVAVCVLVVTGAALLGALVGMAGVALWRAVTG